MNLTSCRHFVIPFLNHCSWLLLKDLPGDLLKIQNSWLHPKIFGTSRLGFGTLLSPLITSTSNAGSHWPHFEKAWSSCSVSHLEASISSSLFILGPDRWFMQLIVELGKTLFWRPSFTYSFHLHDDKQSMQTQRRNSKDNTGKGRGAQIVCRRLETQRKPEWEGSLGPKRLKLTVASQPSGGSVGARGTPHYYTLTISPVLSSSISNLVRCLLHEEMAQEPIRGEMILWVAATCLPPSQ